jgi:hypothetical protein
MKKVLAGGLMAIAAVALLATTFSAVSAQSYGNSNITQRIAERFNLQESEVQSIFDEAREEKMAVMEEKAEERLNVFVENGKISEEQKEIILNKKEEMKTLFEDLKNLSPEERHGKMQELREDLKIWAEENGIEAPFGMGFMNMGLKRGGFGQFKGDCPFVE